MTSIPNPTNFALMTPTPQLPLTEHQTWAVTIALELEQMGWIGAAHALRRKHFPSLNWDDPHPHGVATAKGFEAMLRLHHNSRPPLSDLTPAQPFKTPVHHAAHPAQAVTPVIRSDQSTA